MPYWLESLFASTSAWVIAASAVVVCFFWYLLRRQPKAFRAFDTAGGEVLVTRKAVRELVQRCCEELGEVGSASVDIRVSGKGLRVRVRLRVRRNTNLKGISGYLREQIHQALTENLGIEQVGEIAILVVGILEEPKTVEG